MVCREPGFVRKVLLNAGICAAAGAPHPAVSTSTTSTELQHEILETAVTEKMLPMVLRLAKEYNWEVSSRFIILEKVWTIAEELLYQNFCAVLDDLGSEGIYPMFLKGGAVSLCAYPPELPRMMDDLDLLVKPMDIPAVEAAFKDAGYVQGHFDREGLRVLAYTEEEKAAHISIDIELPHFTKIIRVPTLHEYAKEIDRYLREYNFVVVNEDVYFALEYDVHFNIAKGIDIRDQWFNPRLIQLPTGQRAFCQYPSDMLWFLASRFYHECIFFDVKSPRKFADVLAVSHGLREEIDWDRVSDMIDKYDLHAPLFYVFSHVNELLGEIIPKSMVDLCNPIHSNVSRLHDAGDFIPRLLGGIAVNPILHKQ